MTAISGPQPTLASAARLSPLGASNPKIALPISDGLRFEAVDAIIYLEAAGNYTFLYFKDGERLLVCRTLQDMQDRLAAPNQFLRIHRSFLINAAYLQRYVRGKGGYVILEGGVNLTVSSSRRQEFLNRLERHFR